MSPRCAARARASGPRRGVVIYPAGMPSIPDLPPLPAAVCAAQSETVADAWQTANTAGRDRGDDRERGRSRGLADVPAVLRARRR